MGNSYAKLQDYEKAIECFDKILKINPELYQAQFNIEILKLQMKLRERGNE
jgi:tetratricopeptide (TPR) repeat protein